MANVAGLPTEAKRARLHTRRSTEDVQKKLKQLQQAKKKSEQDAYINPDIAETVRQEGNELFKAGKYPEAIEKYTDAMKRHPTWHVPYSNRAACYQKLMEWQLALKDADRCVEMDATFVKGWTRKAGIHFFLKEVRRVIGPPLRPPPPPATSARHVRPPLRLLLRARLAATGRGLVKPAHPHSRAQFHKALDAYNAVLKIEPENEEAKNGLELTIAKINSGSEDDLKERQARAMQDPEIQAILGDPQMRSILNEVSGSQDAGKSPRHTLARPSSSSSFSLPCGATDPGDTSARLLRRAPRRCRQTPRRRRRR